MQFLKAILQSCSFQREFILYSEEIHLTGSKTVGIQSTRHTGNTATAHLGNAGGNALARPSMCACVCAVVKLISSIKLFPSFMCCKIFASGPSNPGTAGGPRQGEAYNFTCIYARARYFCRVEPTGFSASFFSRRR